MTSRPPGARGTGPAGRTDQSRRGESRYGQGERRTTAEPLAAAWQPERADRPKRRRKRGVAGVLATYGWRVYAIPVLVVVTILVVVNTGQQGGNATALTGSTTGATTSSGPPVATEGSAVPVNAGTGTAVLPPGPNYATVGAGTWHVVPGNGAVVGHGAHIYHYQVAVEDGIDPAVYGGDDAFAATVDATLDNPLSWIAAGTISLQRVDANYQHPDFIVSLTTPNTDHRPDLCDYQIKYETSCWRSSAHRVIINLARWVRGALAFNGDMGLYREYAINHEVGHVFGNQHVGCASNGGLAPVMMQQTFGVSDDYVFQVNQPDPSNRTKVPADGKVCRPNAWPYPQGPANSADAPPG